MSAGPTDRQLVGLCRALDGILGGAGDAADGVGTVLPALASLPLLDLRPGEIHRRCLLALSDGGPAARSAAVPVVTARTCVERGGWELRQVGVQVGGVEVRHWLAREVGAAPASRGPGGRRRDGLAAGTAGADSPGGPRSAGDGPLASVRVSAASVTAWARASGDDNPIHLQPTAAAQAGLDVGEQEVVAHGLMLAALSAACVAARYPCDLRFLAPVGVPLGGGAARVDVGSRGDLWCGGVRVLTRQQGGGALR